jgi:tetratricopeptide (TPR) repeat protein
MSSQSAEAFDLWQEGRLAEAEEKYRAALAGADPKHYATSMIHHEFASLLAQMNRLFEAVPHYERALQLELQQTSDETDACVITARYFLGEHYLRMGEAESARRVVAPSLEASDKPLAWIVEAEALYLCGSVTGARAAGDRALALALSPEQRERIRDRLAPLWHEGID